MKILVLGGTTFVSWYVVKRLAENGHDVTTVTRGTKKGIHGVRVSECYADRHDINQMKPILNHIEFDYLIDISGYTETDVEIVYQCIADRKIRNYIFISSSAVYRESNILPIKESFETGENGVWAKYGTDKLAAEKFLMKMNRENNLPVTILRPPYIYGEGNNVYREAFIFDRLRDNLPIIVPDNGETLVQFIHIEDLYTTILRLLENGVTGEIFNVGNNSPISFYNWVTACMDAYGRTTPIVKFNNYKESGYTSRDFFPFFDYQYHLDISRISTFHKPEIDMKTGLKKALDWYKNNEACVAKRTHYGENCAAVLKSRPHM